ACHDPARVGQTEVTQPALFAVEYALAQLWLARGIQPAAMIGHSVGEYAAAVLARVMSLEDALRLVAGRAEIVQEIPPGAKIAAGGDARRAPARKRSGSAARQRSLNRRGQFPAPVRALRDFRRHGSCGEATRSPKHRRPALEHLARVPLGDDGTRTRTVSRVA